MAKLFYPNYYTALGKDIIDSIDNGCGTEGWKGKLVPDTIYGLCVREPCRIHDVGYYLLDTIKEKEECDRIFLNNLLRVIEEDSKWYHKPVKILMRVRARTYYNAVKYYGGPAFWAGKEEEGEFRSPPSTPPV